MTTFSFWGGVTLYVLVDADCIVKVEFYIYFIELVSFNTEMYPIASACFYVKMFSWNHNTHWIQDIYIEAKQVERSQRRGTTLMCVLISEC